MTTDTTSKKRSPKSLIELLSLDDPNAFRKFLKNRSRRAKRKPEIVAGETGFIHFSALYGARNITNMLVNELEFDPWLRDKDGFLAIDHALAKGYVEIYEILDDAMYPAGWHLDT